MRFGMVILGCLYVLGCGNSETSSTTTDTPPPLDTNGDSTAPPDTHGQDTAPPSGCAATNTVELDEGPEFKEPGTIIRAGKYLFVANRNTQDDFTAGPGWVTAISLDDLEVKFRIGTSRPDPTHLAIHDNSLVVVNRGVTVFDENWVSEGAGPGSIDLIALNEEGPLSVTYSIEIPWSQEDKYGSAPHGLAILPGTNIAYVGSGTSCRLFKVDLSTCDVLNGPTNPIVVHDGGANQICRPIVGPSNTLLISSFNTDTIHTLDTVTDTVAGTAYATSDDPVNNFMGTSSMVFDADSQRVYFLAEVAAKIGYVDLTSGDVTTDWATTGLYPIGLTRSNSGGLLTANNGDATIQEVSTETGAAAIVTTLVSGSGPAGVTHDDTKLYVALGSYQGVAVVDAKSGMTDALLPPHPCTVPSSLPKSCFKNPTTITIAPEFGQYVLVANSNLDPDTFEAGAGFVTVLDRWSHGVVTRIPTSQPNPHTILIEGSKAYIINSGSTTYDFDSGMVLPTGPGSVDIVDLSDLSATPITIAISNDPGTAVAGAPGSAVKIGDKLYIGSTTAALVVVVDLAESAVITPMSDPIWVNSDTTSPHQAILSLGPNGLIYLAEPNSDTLHIFDPTDDALNPAPYKAPYKMSTQESPSYGLLDKLAVYKDTTVYAKLGVSNSVSSLDLGTEAVTTGLFTVGEWSGGVGIHGDVLYVLQGKDATIGAYNITENTYDPAIFTMPDTASNPWSIALEDGFPEGTLGWVTNYGTDSVSIIDLTSGQMNVTVSGP
jgi:hypothetical protein